MKKIATKVWVHKSAVNQLKDYKDYVKKIIDTNKEIEFDVVRLDIKTYDVTLIKVEDWYNQLEPVLMYSTTIKKDGTITTRKESENNPTIYHQKELFVNYDFTGFDVEKAYKRTEQWKALGLPSTKIGRYNYWKEQLEIAGLEYSKRLSEEN